MAEANKGPNGHGAAAAFGICDSHNARYVNPNGRLPFKLCHVSRLGTVQQMAVSTALGCVGGKMAELLMKSSIARLSRLGSTIDQC